MLKGTQFMTEKAGGSDVGATRTEARYEDGHWLLTGEKWFASNCNGEAFVVLAKPEGAPDSSRGVATFLVLRTRRDGSRNGVRVRRLKEQVQGAAAGLGAHLADGGAARADRGALPSRRGPRRRRVRRNRLVRATRSW